MGLEIEVTEGGDGGRGVALRGRLDSQTAQMLDERLELILSSATALLFDMAGLEYISSAGLRVLVKARKALEARGGGVAVAHLQPPVRRGLDILKAVPSIDIFAADAQQEAFIERMQRRAQPWSRPRGDARVAVLGLQPTFWVLIR